MMGDNIDKSEDITIAGQIPRSTVRDLQENFTKCQLGRLSAARDTIADRKHQFDLSYGSPNHNHPMLERSNTDFTRISTVSKRLEDLRKKTSMDCHIGRDLFARKCDENEVNMSHESMSSLHVNLDKKESEEDVQDKLEPAQKLDRMVGSQIRRELELTVGFSSIPDQIYRKSLRKGFHFVILVTGEAGLGKSTFINSLFLTDVYSSSGIFHQPEKTTQVREHQVQLEENGVKLSLTVVDTPGYGDNVDNSDCWEGVMTYVDTQFDTFLQEETRVPRVKLADKRVHACLYFISPNGHGLKNIDIECMKRLHRKVNIIPVIGKSDACTKEELIIFKARIREQLVEEEINVYKFPRDDSDKEDDFPFAVVGSNVLIDDDRSGRKFRGRKYPWGCVNIEEESHSDFALLRRLLLCEYTQDLIDTTTGIHYENYRFEKLSKLLPPEEEEEEEESDEGLTINEEEIEAALAEDDSTEDSSSEEEVKVETEEQLLELEGRRSKLDREKVEWATRMRIYASKSTESLTKKRAFRLSVGNFKFGRQ